MSTTETNATEVATNTSTTNEPATSKPTKNKAHSQVKYEQKLDYPEGVTRVSRRDTGLTKQRVAVLFGYIGTGYYGLQWDDAGVLPTIEKELEEAIYKIGAILETNHKNLEKVKWMRSSRTDKGVHALGNLISMFMELPAATFEEDPLGLKVAEKINEHLPATIRVFSVVKVSRKFNPRDQCTIRTYNIVWPRKYIDESEHNLAAINGIMSQFHGHHNFHNFTRAQHCYKPFPGVNYSTPASSSAPTPSASTTDTTTTSTTTDTTASSSSAPTPSTTTTDTTTTSNTSTEPSADAPRKSSSVEDEEDSEGDGEDDTGGEAKPAPSNNKKPARPQGKPRGFKAPPKREDQIKTFSPHDSYVRRMIYMGVETPFTLGGEEWVPFKFVGESFAYNQIRKMLGYVLHIAHKHVPLASLDLALDSPFKIHVPMTPGECLYLLGGTYSDRKHLIVDPFQFLPKDHEVISSKFGMETKPLPWHQLLEQCHTSTAPGAVVLQKMKDFRDNVLHPHIAQLYQTTNSYQEFVEGIKQDRFKIFDLEECQKLFEEWKKEQNDRKEKKRQFFADRDGEQKKPRGNKNNNNNKKD